MTSSSARFDDLQQKFEENPRRYFAPLANEFRKAGNPRRAAELCRTFLPQMPEHLSGHVVLGQALQQLEAYEEARQTFETVLALDPENVVALRAMGDMARRAGDSTEARRWYGRLVDVDPRDPEAIALLRAQELGAELAPAPRDRASEPAAAEPPAGGEAGSQERFAPAFAADGAEDLADADAARPEDTPRELDEQHEAEEFTAGFFATVLDDDASRESGPAAAREAGEELGLAEDFIDLSARPTEPVRPQTPLDHVDALPSAVELEATLSGSRAGHPPAPAAPEPPVDEPAVEEPVAEEPVVEEPPVEPVGAEAPAAAPDSWTPPRGADDAEDRAAAAAQEGERPVGFVTETMAALYLQQGFRAEALRVYEQLLAQDPGNEALRGRVATLAADFESPSGAGVEEAPAPVEERGTAPAPEAAAEEVEVLPTASAGGASEPTGHGPATVGDWLQLLVTGTLPAPAARPEPAMSPRATTEPAAAAPPAPAPQSAATPQPAVATEAEAPPQGEAAEQAPPAEATWDAAMDATAEERMVVHDWEAEEVPVEAPAAEAPAAEAPAAEAPAAEAPAAEAPAAVDATADVERERDVEPATTAAEEEPVASAADTAPAVADVVRPPAEPQPRARSSGGWIWPEDVASPTPTPTVTEFVPQPLAAREAPADAGAPTPPAPPAAEPSPVGETAAHVPAPSPLDEWPPATEEAADAEPPAAAIPDAALDLSPEGAAAGAATPVEPAWEWTAHVPAAPVEDDPFDWGEDDADAAAEPARASGAHAAPAPAPAPERVPDAPFSLEALAERPVRSADELAAGAIAAATASFRRDPALDAELGAAAAEDPLSLDQLLAATPAAGAPVPPPRPAASFSFEQFFRVEPAAGPAEGAGPAPSAGPSEQAVEGAPAAGEQGGDDLDEFHAWLAGLSKS